MNDFTNGYGSVSHGYRIGKFEVTNEQYTEFLDAVAKTDQYSLYDAQMASSPLGGITQSGPVGSHSYDVKPGMAFKPVLFVSFWDAARFANWLHNGQPSGIQDSTTTEDGAYTLNGYNGTDGSSIERNSGATWFLPSEDEWYKAAYHKNDGVTGNYWLYPTQSDTPPTAEAPPGGTNSANFNGAGGGLTDVGAYVSSHSAYGTFDQDGNVIEWTESKGVIGSRRQKGGAWPYGADLIVASNRGSALLPTGADNVAGFRVATIPEPGALALAALGVGAGLIGRRRKMARQLCPGRYRVPSMFVPSSAVCDPLS
jgi:formylglycine-generating enzyme required for sulfatase activity